MSCKLHCLSLLLLFVVALSAAPPDSSQQPCPTAELQVERLPDLNVARSSHFTLFVGGEAFVVGGHTNGFRPTATAEYFSDGQWHLLNTVYTHDGGMALPLSSGRVLIAGGYRDDLGIGQIHSVEMYDPATHTFDGFGCLDTRRAQFGGVEMDSGRVLITGNWYHDDAIELFDGQRAFTHVKAVEQQRTRPYVFRTSPSNAVIFSCHGPHLDVTYDSIIVDRLHGEPFTPTLFRQWKPCFLHANYFSEQSRIDLPSSYPHPSPFTYLFPVADSTGQVAIAQVSGQGDDELPVFSLLPTDCPVPMRDDRWREHLGGEGRADWTGDIGWGSPVIVDRQAHRAFLFGFGSHKPPTASDSLYSEQEPFVYYVLAIDYDKSPSRLTLYYTRPLSSIGFSIPVLTPDGDLLLAGGGRNTNFRPFASALILRVGSHHGESAAVASPVKLLLLMAALLLLLAAVLVGFLFWRRRKARSGLGATESVGDSDSDMPEAAVSADSTVAYDDAALMERINTLMEQQQLYLNTSLTVADVAALLGVHRNAVSQAINALTGASFAQYVGRYRVKHAQQLLRQEPNKKMTAVCTESGFASETTFFRNFKALTGMTPSEWVRIAGEENSDTT